jgi:hypothetical protein
MEPPPISTGRRWKASRERALADKLLDFQGLCSELTSAFSRIEYRDCEDQRTLVDFLAACALTAPVAREMQRIRERDLAILEGRVPQGPGGASARVQRAA